MPFFMQFETIAFMSALVALIADVQHSRRLQKFPQRRDQALARLSASHRASGALDADYAVTAWDEFQGLLIAPAHLPRVLWDLYAEFQPMKLRLGIGAGLVERLPGAGPINETATGPAFIHAREALQQVSTARRGVGVARLAVVWPDPGLQAALNASLRLLDLLIDQITPTQWNVIRSFEDLGRQDLVANTLKRNESTISRSLAAAHYWDIQASLADLESLLQASLPASSTIT